MKVALTNEYHFLQGPDGVYTDSIYPYSFWASLLDTFDEVVVLARVRNGQIPPTARRVDGLGVRVAAIRDFTGSGGLAANLPGLVRVAWRVGMDADAFVLRAPGVVATALHGVLRVLRRPYGISVVGDPRDSLAAGDWAMRVLRVAAARQLRAQVRGAVVSRFVTTAQLQRSYPPSQDSLTVAVSDLELPDEMFERPCPPVSNGPLVRLGFVGSLARRYKGLDILLRSLALTAHAHTLAIAGEGPERAALQAQAHKLGIARRVTFLGQLPSGGPIFDFLRSCDVFVLPSRTEGLPRALVEAMAVGLPALATPVGGVPELLDSSEHVAIDDVDGLARAIDRLAADPARRAQLAAQNRERARAFRASITRGKLRWFYEAVRAAST